MWWLTRHEDGFCSIRGVVKLKFVKLSSSSCNKWTWKDEKDVRQHSISQQEDRLSFNFNEETFRGVL